MIMYWEATQFCHSLLYVKPYVETWKLIIFRNNAGIGFLHYNCSKSSKFDKLLCALDNLKLTLIFPQIHEVLLKKYVAGLQSKTANAPLLAMR